MAINQVSCLVLCALITATCNVAANAANGGTQSPPTKSTGADARLDFERATTLLDSYRGDPATLEAARSALVDILRHDPAHAPAHREMARYYIMRGHISYERFRPGSLEAAEKHLKESVRINPQFAEAYVLFGHLYRLMNRPIEAKSALTKAEALGTSDPWLHNNWADLLINEGKFDEAAKHYRNVIDSKSANKKARIAALEGLSTYYERTRQLDRADEIYRKELELEPDAAWGYGNYAHFLLCRRDDPEAAILRAREALRLMDYGAGRFILGAALYQRWAQRLKSGDRTAQKFFEEAHATYPDPYAVAAAARECPPLQRVGEALSARSRQR